jgi:O-antigen ligase
VAFNAKVEKLNARMIAARDGVRHLAAAAGWIALSLPLAIVLLSVAVLPASNWTVRTTLAGFCILAVVRPAAALLVTVALGGFGIILSVLAGVPHLRVTEVLIVGSLAGCCVRALPHGTPFRRALTGGMSVPVVLFAIAAVASTIVWQRVHQAETGYASAYVEALIHFVSRDYFVQPGDFWVLVSTAAMLEGLALYVVVAALCQVDAAFFGRALRMLVVGGAGLAVMSAVRLAEIHLRNPDIIGALRAGGALRISPQIPDFIAAGSYFALCWLVALGIAMAASRRRLVWVVAAAPLMAALYLAGSRSPIAAALVGLVVLVFIVVRQRPAAGRGVVACAVLAVFVMVLSYPWLTGRDVAGELARQSLTIRVELARTALRVIATRPLFGVGIDRFHLSAGELASPELDAMWPARKNPHNDFLRVGAELGLVGLGMFLWILAAAGRRIWQALWSTRDARLAGLAGGLVAWLITSLVSDPLMVREVSYVFWIALGLAVGSSAGPQAPRDVPDGGMSASGGTLRRVSRWQWPIALLLGGLLVFSIPFRARRELATVDLTRVTYGLFDWGTEPDGTRSRWSGPRATLFVDGRARLIEIPLIGTLPGGVLQHVEVRVDGRLANRIAVGPQWQRLRTPLPEDPSTGPRRIDLLVSPTWVGNEGRRVLGVKVGEPRVIMNPSQVR